MVTCADGIKRRIYLRLLTYSADYPEKMLMLSLRDKGICPCPHCLTPKNAISQLGKKRDHARQEMHARSDTPPLHTDIVLACQLIYDQTGYAVNSKAVNDILKPQSRVLLRPGSRRARLWHRSRGPDRKAWLQPYRLCPL
jgi:Plavaka transposase